MKRLYFGLQKFWIWFLSISFYTLRKLATFTDYYYHLETPKGETKLKKHLGESYSDLVYFSPASRVDRAQSPCSTFQAEN